MILILVLSSAQCILYGHGSGLVYKLISVLMTIKKGSSYQDLKGGSWWWRLAESLTNCVAFNTVENRHVAVVSMRNQYLPETPGMHLSWWQNPSTGLFRCTSHFQHCRSGLHWKGHDANNLNFYSQLYEMLQSETDAHGWTSPHITTNLNSDHT